MYSSRVPCISFIMHAAAQIVPPIPRAADQERKPLAHDATSPRALAPPFHVLRRLRDLAFYLDARQPASSDSCVAPLALATKPQTYVHDVRFQINWRPRSPVGAHNAQRRRDAATQTSSRKRLLRGTHVMYWRIWVCSSASGPSHIMTRPGNPQPHRRPGSDGAEKQVCEAGRVVQPGGRAATNRVTLKNL